MEVFKIKCVLFSWLYVSYLQKKKKVTGTCNLGVEKPMEFRFEYGYDHTFGKLVNDMIW